MKLESVVATYDLGERLARRMRASDADEVRASAGYTPLQAVRESMETSDLTFCGLADGEPFVIYGVASEGDVGVPWMLATDEIFNHPVAFLRGARDFTSRLQRSYRRLFNFVDQRNTTSIRWLKWLGYTVHPAVPYGWEQRPFHPFTWEFKSDV